MTNKDPGGRKAPGLSINRAEAQVIKKEIKMAYEDDDIDMEDFLRGWGYKNVEEWALDSDYEYDDNIDVWFDEEGKALLRH